MENITIRPEREDDYRTTENLIREAFWNVYRPGAFEHYVIHVLRDDPAFVKELDYVMELSGKIIGQNVFMKTVINADSGEDVPVLTMGPICISPELQRTGYGKKLLDFTLEKAAAMKFGAVLFEGNIGFYGKCGFGYARDFGIRYHDLPEDADSSFFLCLSISFFTRSNLPLFFKAGLLFQVVLAVFTDGLYLLYSAIFLNCKISILIS